MNEMSAFFDAMIFRLGWMLVHSIWQAGLVAGMLAIGLRAGRGKLSTSLRYAVSYAALLIIAGASATTMMVVRPPADLVRSHRTTGAIRVTDRPIDAPPSILASTLVHPQTLAQPWNPESALPWLVGAWVIGVMILSVWQLGGWMILQRWRHSAKAVEADLQQRVDQLAWKMAVRRVVLKLSEHVDVPIVIGVWRPVVLAPMSILTDLSASQLEAILAHELAHVRRLDYIANLIHVAIETLLFYHPAVWWISRQIRLERECCCDELAASACANRTEYVRALTMMEQTRGPRLAPAITGRGGRGELLTRVRRLLGVSQGSTRSGVFEMRSWATSALLLSVLLGIAGSSRILRAQQQPQSAQLPDATAKNGPDAPVPSDNMEPREFRGIVPANAQPIVTTVQPEDLVAGPVEDYKIGRNDLVQVSLTDLIEQIVETQKVSRVTESGFISLPRIGQIKAAGLTATELEVSIAKTYRNQKLLANPQVSVVVLEARNRSFTIGGAIAKPGQYQMLDSRMTLMDAVAQAGGAEKNASVSVHRHVGDGPQLRVIEIPAAAITSGDPKFNIIIRPLDFIVVTAPPIAPETAKNALLEQETKILLEQLIQAKIDAKEAQATYGPGHPKVAGANHKVQIIQQMLDDAQLRVGQRGDPPVIEDQPQDAEYYVGGYVDRTGVYSLTPPRNTLRFAITQAGPPPAGKTYYAQIIRHNGRQEEIISNIPLQELLEGKVPDIPLKADDQIVVLDHRTSDAPTTNPSSPHADANRTTNEVNAQVYAWDVLNDRMRQGEALTPTFVQLMLDTSDRLCQAQARAANNGSERVAAIETHLDRCAQLADLVRQRQGRDTGRVQLSQVNSAIQTSKAVLTRLKLQERRPATLPGIQSDANPFPVATPEQAAKVNAQAYAWDALQQRQQNGEALTPTFVQLLLDTSERLAAAQNEAAVTWPQRVAAAEGNLNRIIQLAQIVYKRQGQDTSRVYTSQCISAIESARDTVIRMKASARDAGEPQ